MKLNPGQFNRHLAHMGQVVSWRASSACPCANEFSGAADPECPQCRGKGHIWAPAVNGVVGVTAQKVRPEWREFGNYEQGDMVATIGSDSPLYAMGRFDRVVLKNSTDRFSRVYTRGVNDLDIDIPVKAIARVYWLSANKQTIIEGGIPTINPATGAPTWATGEPSMGTQYSMTGEKFDEYFVWNELSSDRNEHQGAPLPKRVTLRKWDLFGR